MANLNFQQPLRNVTSTSLASRNNGGFNSGHVTPTSGMFPTSAFSQPQHQGQQNPQLSPNRNILAGSQIGRASSMIGQRAFSDRRQISGIGTQISNGSFMQSRLYGGQGTSIGNFHVFGSNISDTVTPPLLDLSEFPSLTNSRGPNDQSSSNAMQPPGNKPYVGMVKQPLNEQTEFTMSNEDFPALPGTQNIEGNTLANSIEDSEKISNIGASISMGMDLHTDNVLNEQALKRGVQTSADGKVTNIPASMVNNQFGMVGLLTFIRAAESDPNLVSLAMGQDLTALGLNLNSLENLYPSFGGPFGDAPARPQDIDFNVPPEYLINSSIKDKLSPVTLKKYKEDLLFYLFYTSVNDLMQVAAAAELHSRDWRYHLEEKVWITRAPGFSNYDTNGTSERGTFYYFDAQNWRRVAKEFQVDMQKLEQCPNLNLGGMVINGPVIN